MRKRRKKNEEAKQYNTLPNYDAIATAEDCVWSQKSAEHACRFIENVCKLTEGSWSGKPFMLLPWQRALVANLYGWLRPDGTRRYRQAHILIPRKSGKTELAASIALYHLLADDEPTPEVVGIARDRSQARLCLKRACAMADMEERVKAMTEQYTGRLVCPKNYGVYKVLSADAPSAHGLNVSACIADEIHAMENRRDLWEAVMTSMGARKQPLMLSITTAGTLRESLEYDLFSYAKKVQAGTVENKAFLPCLYYADEADDWREPKTWAKANPSMGHTTTMDWYRSESRRAHDQPSYESAFRTYFLCQHITTSQRWIRMADWDACQSLTDDSQLVGLPCFMGIDLAQTTDLTSIAMLWKRGQGYIVRSFNFAPLEGAQERARRDSVPYLEWSQRGWLTLTDGETTDYAFVRQKVLDLAARFNPKIVAYDPYNAQNLGNELLAQGINVMRCPQSFVQLATPTRLLERAVMSKQLEHDGNPVLAWAVSNTVLDIDVSQNPRPSKRKSVERIDPVVALITAIAASVDEEKRLQSVYNKRELIWL